MFAALRQVAQNVLGRGDATITVPSFDGALKPNQALEQAETLFTAAAPEDFASDGASLYLADGPRLQRLDAAGPVTLRSFEAPISALAFLPGGRLAVALAGREVRVYAQPDAAEPLVAFAPEGLRCVNALAPAGPDALYATDGSAAHGPDKWVWDLMERGRTGRLLRLDLASRRVEVKAKGLAYAFGVAAMGEAALVAESWRHRLIAVGANSAPILSNLPVYPSRLSPAQGGGWWLTAFVARTQLVEFVLREPAYRRRMMKEIAPEHWVAPRLGSGQSFKEPMQGAHLKTMGVIKPWAPPRSYGLVIRLDAQGQPLFSLHSRVDGVNHGIVAACEHAGHLYLIAKGPGRVLRLPLQGLDKS